MDTKRIENFIFYDGIKEIAVDKTYDNWLTSLNYDDYSKAFIIVNHDKIKLFDTAKELKVGQNFDSKELEAISERYNLLLIDNERGLRCSTKSHFSERFYIIRENGFVVIYSLGGTKSFESIYLHGVWIYP
ncbi:hypothetical protein [Chryseobacterium jejuense]|uniref:hypothetical protein n=1 Tax=Chryseobacterium jejuense TaxID=445960 RepID=UPI001AE183E4|nr:hypothetical protein [Chryseobacterium jejuense]MBP2617881.1 hypothetical protein [Chryseobacterium jejuense]